MPARAERLLPRTVCVWLLRARPALSLLFVYAAGLRRVALDPVTVSLIHPLRKKKGNQDPRASIVHIEWTSCI